MFDARALWILFCWQPSVHLWRRDFNVPYETHVISAHRSPDNAHEYAKTAIDRGLRCIIVGAGGAVHLAGVLAENTTLPTLGVYLRLPNI